LRKIELNLLYILYNMEEIKEKMMLHRNPRTNHLRSESTVISYINSLKALHLRMFNDLIKDLDWLNEVDLILSFIKEEFKTSTQNNYLNAIIAGLETMGNQEHNNIAPFRKLMMENNEETFNKSMEQSKSVTQTENWLSLKELQQVSKRYNKELLFRKTFKKTAEEVTPAERELLKNWLISSLYTADPVNNPPLRADYAGMKIISADDYARLDEEGLKKNYLVIKNKTKKVFSLGKYKTASIYGIKHIPVAAKLNTVLNKFLKLHTKDHLFYNCSGKTVLTSNAFAKLVPRVFESTGKHITINLLRHVVISEFDTSPPLAMKAALADKMCHGVGTQAHYTKQ